MFWKYFTRVVNDTKNKKYFNKKKNASNWDVFNRNRRVDWMVICSQPMFSLGANRYQMIWIEFFGHFEWLHGIPSNARNFSEAAPIRYNSNRCDSRRPRPVAVKHLRWPKFVGGHHQFPIWPFSVVFWRSGTYQHRHVWHLRGYLFGNSTAQWSLQYALLSGSERFFS